MASQRGSEATVTYAVSWCHFEIRKGELLSTRGLKRAPNQVSERNMSRSRGKWGHPRNKYRISPPTYVIFCSLEGTAPGRLQGTFSLPSQFHRHLPILLLFPCIQNLPPALLFPPPTSTSPTPGPGLTQCGSSPEKLPSHSQAALAQQDHSLLVRPAQTVPRDSSHPASMCRIKE